MVLYCDFDFASALRLVSPWPDVGQGSVDYLESLGVNEATDLSNPVARFSHWRSSQLATQEGPSDDHGPPN